MKAIPPVSKYMTTCPHSVGSDQALGKAMEAMTKLHIRHLPVLHGGKLKGILSDRDIKLVLGFSGTKVENLSVGDVYQEEAYVTDASTRVSDVAMHMAEKKLGSALVTDNGKLVGIFTTVDALKVLSELFETRLKG